MIALSITSCKRLHYFEKTVSSFYEYCKDSCLLDLILWYDDSSSIEDRLEMMKILLKYFKNKKIISTFFSEKSFDTNKRHKEIMNVWKKDLTHLSLDYVLHTEDDFEYINNFYIEEAIQLLKTNNDVASVGFSQEKRKLPEEFGKLNIKGNFWEWFYLKNRPLLDGLFLDEVIMKKHPHPNFWCKFINWPYFGFRPALHDVKKIEKLDGFRDVDGSFELEFAIRFSKLYKSFCHINEICKHIGHIDSYNLNKSSR